MAIINHNDRTLRLLGVLSVGLLIVTGCAGRGSWGVWESNDSGAMQLRLARFNDDNPARAAATIADRGELPAAVATENQVFIAYILRNGERGRIWCVTVRKSIVSFS